MKGTILLATLVLFFTVACNVAPFGSEPTQTPVALEPAPPQPTGAPANPNQPGPGLPRTPGQQPPPPRATGERPPFPPGQKPGETPIPKPGAHFTPPAKPGANITPPGIPDGMAKTYAVTNPTTNAKLAVYVFAPQDTSGKKFPAVVLVPGGNGAGQGLSREAIQFANAGIVALAFDPDGRGKSEGTEDYAGFKQQDGLVAVIRFAATLPQVDAQQIGIATYSYGITMGSGALARYPDLPVKFLIDWEGPVDRDDTTVGCRNDGKSRIPWQPCSDNAFWSEREAITFIAKVRVPYQRIQSEKDHVQPDVSHAINIVNAAVKAGVPWVRLNDDQPNQTYDVKNPPQMLPESQDAKRDALVIKYAQELVKK